MSLTAVPSKAPGYASPFATLTAYNPQPPTLSDAFQTVKILDTVKADGNEYVVDQVFCTPDTPDNMCVPVVKTVDGTTLSIFEVVKPGPVSLLQFSD